MRPLLVLLLAVLASPAADSQTELPDILTERERAIIGPPRIKNLTQVMANYEAAILMASGRRETAGVVLDAYLSNATGEPLYFDIYLDQPLYLRNKDRDRRDMIVTRVYMDFGYFLIEEGRKHGFLSSTAYIEPVDLWAYSVDFDKDNPTHSDEFELQKVPAALQDIVSLIGLFEREAADLDDDDTMRTAQVALWKAQGVPEMAILERYPHEYEHMQAARILLGEE